MPPQAGAGSAGRPSPGLAMRTLVSISMALAFAAAPGMLEVQARHFRDLFADGDGRVDCGVRVLVHHGDLGAPDLAHLLIAAERKQFDAVQRWTLPAATRVPFAGK